jgi:dihydrofolate reductase
MGDLVLQQFVSVDGFAANDRNEFDLFDGMEGDSSEFDRANLEWLETVGAIVLGASTYRMFSGYWPTPRAEGELVAPKINSLPKYVFSRSLNSAPWGRPS